MTAWQVGASTDDCRRENATFDTNGIRIIAGHRDGLVDGSGVRFLNITIPQGSTINSAAISVRARVSDPSTGVKTKITGDDEDNAATFSDLTDYNGRPRTTAAVDWDPSEGWTADTWYDSVDISAVIQEIVNRAGWVSGNALALFWEDDGSASDNKKDCYSWDNVNANACKLTVTYTAGGVLKEVTDSLGLSDSVLRHKTLLPITDVLGLADAVLRNKTLTIADSVGAADSVKGDKSPLIVSDVLSLADLVNVITGAIIKTVLDTIGLADLALVNKPVAIADTVSVLDAIFRHKPSVTVSDAIGAAEVVLVAKLLAVADSVNLADVARVLKTLNVSDSLTLVDAVSTPSRVLQVTESISLTEVVEVGTGGVKKTRLFLILGDLAVQLAGD
jgi:hypothetical protein